MKRDSIVIAPHPDDEIIGCSEHFNEVSIVMYGERINESENLKNFEIELMEFNWEILLGSSSSIPMYFPDPVYEFHPDHRYYGAMGEKLLRKHGKNVIFYSVNMMAPYIHKVKRPGLKLELLNKLYPTKKDLWEYEQKYYLFEGYTKWLV